MTIPMMVMLVSGFGWLLWAVVLPDNSPTPIPRFAPWFIDLCRIVFAASVLVVLWANMNERAF